MADYKAPSLRLFAQEIRWLPNLVLARRVPKVSPRERVADGVPVMTLPGFCAADDSMRQLRQNLRAAGFNARGWGLGRNLGAKPDTIDRIDQKVRAFYGETGQKVHLVGWSLGGIMAREYAKYHPDEVASVISLGSPFSGSRRDNHAWRLYELVARHPIDAPPIPNHEAKKPPVPTYALWSQKDGIVSVSSARGAPEESDVTRELGCGHLGFAFDPVAIEAVIESLTEIGKSAALTP